MSCKIGLLLTAQKGIVPGDTTVMVLMRGSRSCSSGPHRRGLEMLLLLRMGILLGLPLLVKRMTSISHHLGGDMNPRRVK